MCPLCSTHLDNQDLSLMCREIRKANLGTGNTDEIYEEETCKETVQTIYKLSEYRKEKNRKYIEENEAQVHCVPDLEQN